MYITHFYHSYELKLLHRHVPVSVEAKFFQSFIFKEDSIACGKSDPLKADDRVKWKGDGGPEGKAE